MIHPLPPLLTDLALFFLRLLIAAVFGSSGWSHASKPAERGESIGMGAGPTRLLGIVEILGAVLLVLGIWDQVGAALLIGVMLGAIHRKIFVWKMSFWGEESNGWYYDLLYLACSLVILTTGGGALGLD